MMKFKRVLLVLTIGVSFAPPVFAAGARQDRVEVKRAGEMVEPNPLGARCETAQLVAKAEADIAEAANANTAGGAR